MKYFTPQLYIDFNSDDPASADAADEAWEKALSQYQKHIRKIHKRLPEKARDFAQKACLHDASYLGYLKAPVPKSTGELAVVAIQQSENILLLIYVLADEPFLSPPVASPVFSGSQIHWLYDELDATDDGTFLHEILLSNGRILSLRFITFDMLTVNKDNFGQFSADQLGVVANK